jgi:hypothetical protein
MSTKRIKVLTISDHPLLPSGVGTQTKYVIEALLKTGKFEVLSLGGAIKHPDYTPVSVNVDHLCSPGIQSGTWTIAPVDGYSNPNDLMNFIRNWKPDILYFMTDPRFYEWLWSIEDTIRSVVPMVYYHVWDNYPYPVYNDRFYRSNDFVATISKVTSDIVRTVSPEVDELYIPHAVDQKKCQKKTNR